MPLTWTEKYRRAKPAHVAVLDKPFAGVPAGARLLVPSPHLVERALLRTAPGDTVPLGQFRHGMAIEAAADAACPVTTSIALRIVAEIALERIHAGEDPDSVAPFWRVVEPQSPLAAKLSCGAEFLAMRRGLERGAVAA